VRTTSVVNQGCKQDINLKNVAPVNAPVNDHYDRELNTRINTESNFNEIQSYV
jgi:hypothetical protein